MCRSVLLHAAIIVEVCPHSRTHSRAHSEIDIDRHRQTKDRQTHINTNQQTIKPAYTHTHTQTHTHTHRTRREEKSGREGSRSRWRSDPKYGWFRHCAAEGSDRCELQTYESVFRFMRK